MFIVKNVLSLIYVSQNEKCVKLYQFRQDEVENLVVSKILQAILFIGWNV